MGIYKMVLVWGFSTHSAPYNIYIGLHGVTFEEKSKQTWAGCIAGTMNLKFRDLYFIIV